jgi:hypothetical protein
MSHTGMVHALREAWRVLRPGGLALDLRPATVHRRVRVVRGGQPQALGTMRESMADGRAADRAVARMTGRGKRLGAGQGRTTGLKSAPRPPLRFVGRTRVPMERVMDGAADFRAWLADFASADLEMPRHDWLIERLVAALGEAPRKGSVVVSGPLDLRVLRKPEG